MDRTKVALIGATLVLLTQTIDQEQAVEAVDFNTIGLLAGMMLMVKLTEATGVYTWIAIHAGQLSGGRPLAVVLSLGSPRRDGPRDLAPGVRRDRIRRRSWQRGTFVGVSRFLKSMNPQVVCVAVEPAGASVLAGRHVTEPKHRLQGTGYGTVPPLWEPELADAFVGVHDHEAVEYRELLAAREGLHVGYSAAANVCAAVRLLSDGTLPPEGTVATVLCDTGLKY